MSDNCPKCGAATSSARPTIDDEYSERYTCGTMVFVDENCGHKIVQTKKCVHQVTLLEVASLLGQIAQLTAERDALREQRDNLRGAWDDLSNHTDGWNWYWLSYGEKCYAFAVVTAFPVNEDDEAPPAGTYLKPHPTNERTWVGENGVEMMSDEHIASIERQNGDVICKFIAQSFADAQRRFAALPATKRDALRPLAALGALVAGAYDFQNDLSGASIQEWGERTGVYKRVKFDPEVHADPLRVGEAGCDWFVLDVDLSVATREERT